mgnify:CR=1 FL=1
MREAHGGKLYDSSYGARQTGNGQYAEMTNWQLKDDRSGYDGVEWRVMGDEG